MKRLILALASIALFASTSLADEPAEPNPDPGVMSEKYWEFWNDEVQKEIDERIEKFRKADANISIENVKPGSTVKIEQLTSDFMFGAHIFNFNQLGSKELNDKYKSVYGSLFNQATVAFYWKTLEPIQGKPRFEEAPEDTEEFWNSVAEPKKQPHWRRKDDENV